MCRARCPLFSGMLVTKGGVLFTGDQRGRFLAYDAKTGKELWKFQTGSGINASPITYELDGKQYVAILSGLGGDPSFYYSAPKGGMLWVFAIDGKVDEGGNYNAQVIEKMLPSLEAIASADGAGEGEMLGGRGLSVRSAAPFFLLAALPPAADLAPQRQRRRGADRSLPRPARRHRGGQADLPQQMLHLPSSAGGRGPNLFATKLSDEQFLETVINGRKGTQMPAFGLRLSPDEVWQVHAFVKSTDHYGN